MSDRQEELEITLQRQHMLKKKLSRQLQKERKKRLDQLDQIGFGIDNRHVLVDEILAQCNREYPTSNPLKVTFLATQWKYICGSLLIREMAKQLAKFPQLKVTMLVPENNWLSELDKREAQHLYNLTIVEAKKQPGFVDPTEWLNFPAADLSTDIVVGCGEELGKIAQYWKQRNQCKSIHLVNYDYVPWAEKRRHLRLAQSKKERRRNVKNLCQVADIPVAVGPKTTDELSASLSRDRKEVFNLTPGIISEFYNLTHADNDRGKFRVLLIGGDNPDNFQKEGLDIAAKIATELNDKSFLFIYVGAGEGSMEQYVHKFHDECGISKSQLEIRSLPKDDEEWKSLFCEVDLAIMPSGEKAFGLEELLALSAGLPVLVHGDSGFGEALKAVKFGDSAIVDSEDAAVWASEIKKVRKTDRKQRLEQAAELRSQYDKRYNWEEQCRVLVGMMLEMCSDEPEVSYV